ncbi:hypothetical protein NEMBOFW57_010082 [Staphylotrichum longicolle]|uniref:DUF2470 domain-containing protein n=1 Tax=Staphylotrichum longicolle TaxID=669026 RepID=A0AAD4HTR2_9PEZI|nr:hypothetical protein NEMBOFW57_010082 [Staphylotrichum longicolle]
MNKDHRLDMRHILAHYGAVPPPPSAYTAAAATKANLNLTAAEADDTNPLMHDISLTALTLRLPATDTLHAVALDPPLASWEERRARLVEMTRVAREALGVVSSTEEENGGKGNVMAAAVVNEYMPPRVPYDLTIFLAVLFYYSTWVLVQAGGLGAGGAAARVVEGVRFPGGVAGFTWLVRTIFVPVLGIHVFETWLLERTRLRKFGVRRGSRVWWLWVGSVFVEGAMAFKRFDIVVERLKAEGKKKR